jgi:hypothetical protein
MLKSFVDRVKAQKIAKAAEGGRRGHLESPRKPLAQLDKNSPRGATNANDTTNDKGKISGRDGHGDPTTRTVAHETNPAGPKSILKVKKCIYGARENVENLVLLTERITKLNKGQKRIPWLILPDCGPWRRRQIPKMKSVSWNNQLAAYYDHDSRFEILNSDYEGGTGHTPEEHMRIQRRLRIGRIQRQLEAVGEQSRAEPQTTENPGNEPVLNTMTEPRTESELGTSIRSSSQLVEIVSAQALIDPKTDFVPGTRATYKPATEVAPSPSGRATRTGRRAKPNLDVKSRDEEGSKAKQKLIVVSSSELASSSKRRKPNLRTEAKDPSEPTTERKEMGRAERVQTAKGDSHDIKAKTTPPSRIPSRRGTSNTMLRKSRTAGSTKCEKRRSLRLEQLARSRK